MEIFTNEFVELLADKLASKPLFTEKFMDALAEKIAAKLAQHTAKNNTIANETKKSKLDMQTYIQGLKPGCGSSYTYTGGCGSSTPSYRRYNSGGGCGSSYTYTGGC